MDGLFSRNGVIEAAWKHEPTIVKKLDLTSQIPPVADLLDTPLLRPPYLLVMSDGKPIPYERYCRTERVISGSVVEQFIEADLVAAELKAGAGIKFNRVELWNQQIASMARELGQARKMAVKAWGFLSPPGERMFASHRDPAHVIALQLDGTKEWRLDGPCPDEPWDSLADVTPSTESTTLTLEPGDMLYLPYGYAHSAVAIGGYSYHVTFALEGVTSGQVRTQIVKALYDYLELSDGTEIRPDNLPGILANVASTMNILAAGLSNFATEHNKDSQFELGAFGEELERMMSR